MIRARATVSLAAALASCTAPPPPPSHATAPRFMSINLCTDQLLLALLPPERIASVTWLARDPAYGVTAAEARRVPVNQGTAEEVMALAPATVFATPFSTPDTRRLLKRSGYRVVEVPPADDFAGIRRALRIMGAEVGAAPRAEALIAAMDAKLARLAASAPIRRPRVVAWDGGGAAPGSGTLYDAIIGAAGARNVAAERGIARYGRFDVEALLATAPDALIRVRPERQPKDLRWQAAAHPIVARRWHGRMVTIDAAPYGCGTPAAADAALALRAALDRLPPR